MRRDSNYFDMKASFLWRDLTFRAFNDYFEDVLDNLAGYIYLFRR